ncbi:MAG: hypothetical protein K2G97_02255 [Oscillospiraceae bacterium]|nr:hypothetical protein [Oscillospiraceae bacterium]
MEFISYGILLLAAFIGFIHIFDVIEMWIIRSNQPVNSIVIVPLEGHIDEIEILAREFRSKYRKNDNTSLLFVDVGMDKETRDICETFCGDYSDVLLCDDCQVYNLLKMSIAK